jgi:hypothetical protein
MKKFLLFLLFLGASHTLFAQEKFTISGKISDLNNGEELIGATIAVEELSATGSATNVYGFYSITLPSGEYTLRISFVGYQTIRKKINLTENQTFNIELGTGSQKLEEIVISSEPEDVNVNSIEMGTEELQMEKVKVMPALLGEVDILKTLTLMPGVQNAAEGTSGLFVRGGANDQNLILLDDAPVYNASHLLGFFSVFNSDAIKDVKLYKGAMPAQFGGRLSSIIDIRMKDGNSKNFQASGGLGLISSRLTLEGPLKKGGKSSFIVSARRTYADMFLAFSKDPEINDNTLYFYDLNLKANFEINDKNRLFVSGYFGRDVLKFGGSFGMDWGNATGTLRWNHIFNNKLFLNTTLIYSSFDYGFTIDSGVQNFNWNSNLKDMQAKWDFDYFLNPKHTLTFGMGHILHTFSPAKITPDSDDSIFKAFSLEETKAVESAFYINDEFVMNDKLSLSFGLRYSMFQNLGEGTEQVYEEGKPYTEENVIGTKTYKKGDFRNLYHGFEPRFAAKFTVNPQSSFKTSYNRTRQYVQVASNNTASLPFDRWISSNRYIEPQLSDMFSVGYFRNFKDNVFESSLELYYKTMENQIDVKTGGDILLGQHVEQVLLAGKGWSYGMEFMVKKNIGATTGWLSYTLAKTQRKIPGISEGNAYSPRYDRRHDLSLVLVHKLSEKVSLAGNFIYSTGAAVSFPIAKYSINGAVIDFYDNANRNADRMPSYHRMDLSLTYTPQRKHKKWEGSWNFSIYNVYNRKNPFSIYFREVEGEPEKLEAVKTSLFGLIP